ncbi:uncharacterized protein LOC141655655 [Silene latifolia]|uniref:uncharacterized protein LOC141655655 n=1 Tax=Silene latifolia TaxID=37657 RepID=UPI003D76D7C7
MPQCLKDFLRSQNFLFVGVNIADYTSPVMSDHRMVWNLNVKDLQSHLIQKDPRKCFMLGAWPSIKRLANEIVGLDVGATDHIRTGGWEVRGLSDDQIMFACFEAYASYAVGCNFFRGS